MVKSFPSLHPSEDVFESYALNKLRGQVTAAFEEHLLVCEECQSTLAETDDHVRFMKAAMAAYVPPPVRANGFRWNAPAAAILILASFSALLSWRTTGGDVKLIELTAYRGATSRVPAGQPLDFKIDLSDVRAAGGYRVEVVDVTGRRVWFGGTPARLPGGLQPGVYWIRLSTDTGELLREYGLSAETK